MPELSSSGSVVTSFIAYAEAHSALARMLRDKRLVKADHRLARNGFDEFWGGIAKAPVGEDVLQATAGLVPKRPIAGMDAIHLASVIHLADRTDVALHFATWDARHWQAAAKSSRFALGTMGEA